MRIIGAADAKSLPRAICEMGTGVALAEVPVAIRTECNRVQRVIVIAAIKATEQHLALVHLGIKPTIPIDIRIDNQIGRTGNDDLIVNHRDAERGH